MAELDTSYIRETEDGEQVEYTGTPFSAIYNRFLGKITDDMYMELTPEDTIQDLQKSSY